MCVLNGHTSGPGPPFCDTWEERICPEVEQGRDGFRAAFPVLKTIGGVCLVRSKCYIRVVGVYICAISAGVHLPDQNA